MVHVYKYQTFHWTKHYFVTVTSYKISWTMDYHFTDRSSSVSIRVQSPGGDTPSAGLLTKVAYKTNQG